MAARNISLEMDTADSSSDSDTAESGGEEEKLQQTEDALGTHLPTEMDTQDDETLQLDGSITVQDSSDEDDFKAEWVDVFNVPLSILLPGSRQIVRLQGPIHRWKGIDWSTLMVVQQLSLQIGAFIGYDEQPFRLLNETLEVQYQYSLIDNSDDSDDNVLMEGNNGIAGKVIFGGSPAEGRVDNGYHGMFPYDRFMNYLRSVYSKMLDEGQAPPLQDIEAVRSFVLPVRLRVMAEEPYCPRNPNMHHYNSKESTGLVGLENLGATCYLNALLQMLYHVNSFRCAVYKLPHEGENLATSTTLALQTVFRNLQTSHKEVTTKELTVAFGWTSAEAFLQQDVQEMMRVLIDKLEDKMKGTVVDGLTKALFAGQVRSYIKCVNVQYESKRTEDFYDIQLDVKGCKNIYQSFKKYVEVELLDGENQYEAGEHGKQDAQKGVIFETFPPVLTVHLKRFDFDLQTMNFTKIHDHYEFPLRLELDPYLAADCPEESRRVANNYVLHSVLVHQGDVGGGHYYAYIRPTTPSFDYTALSLSADPAALAGLNVAHRDQQWFKFNDEVVSQVPQREAVDVCYGRRMKDSNVFRGLSSAYMLVYIREEEAPEIMRPVTMADIPPGLEERLQTELNAKLAVEKRYQRQRERMCMWYATEEEVASFAEYSRHNDWLHDKSFRPLWVLKDSSKLGVLLAIADALRKTPAELCLWEVDKMRTTYQLGDDIDFDELPHRYKLGHFYVQEKPFAGSAEEFGTFNQTYFAIREQERSLLVELREELASHGELFYSEEEDPVFCCGMGSSNLPLEELRYSSPEVYDRFKNAFTNIRDMLLELLKDLYPGLPEGEILLFVKVYDPYDVLPQLGNGDENLGGAASDEDDELSEDENAEEEDSGGSGGTGVSSVDGALKRRRAQAKASALPHYLPVKYVGSHTVSSNTPVTDLASIIQRLIDSRFPNVPQGWQNECQKFRYYTGQTPADIRVLSAKDVDSRLSFDEATKDDHERVFYVDIIPQHPRELLVPFNITDTKKWLQFQAFKKTITVRPFQPRDAAVLQRRHAERAAELLQRLSSGDVDGNAKLQNPNPLSQSPGSHTMGSPLRKKQKPFLRDRSSSVGSQHSMRDRANSTGSELGMGAMLSPNRTPLSIHRRSVNGKPFQMLVPLMARVSEIIHRLAADLEVESGHLALFFVHQLTGSRAWERRRFETPPITLANCGHDSVKDTLETQKVSMKVNAKYCVFYRINPFSVLAEQSKNLFRTVDFLIVDERIRSWRRLFLEHLNTNNPARRTIDLTEDQSPLNPSTPTRSAETAMEVVQIGAETETTAAVVVQEGNGKRSRSNSEAHSQPQAIGAQGSQRAASVVWPDPPGPYDGREEAMITLRVSSSAFFRHFTEQLRDIAGIPKNFAELEALKLPAGGAADETAAVSLVQEHLQPTETRKTLCFGPLGACSDYLRTSKSTAITPAFPLLVSCVRENVIDQILSAGSVAADVMDSFSELQNVPGLLFFNALQYVSPEDVLFLHGSHPQVRSIALTVFSYTLVDKHTQIMEINGTTPPAHLPFLTYVREDDNYATLARRVASITGEKDAWQELMLATVDHLVPSYIPRTAPAGSTPAASPQPSVRKSFTADSQADSQATEIDPADESSEPIQPPTVPALEPDSPSIYNVARAAMTAVHHAFVGPPTVPPPPPQSMSPSLRPSLSTSASHSNGAASSVVPTSLWRHFNSRYSRFSTRSELARMPEPPLKGSFVRLGIQRGVVSTSPRVGSKRMGGGSIRIV